MAGITTSLDKLKNSADLRVSLIKTGDGDNSIITGIIESMPAIGVSVSYNAPGASVGDKANEMVQMLAHYSGSTAGLHGGINNLAASKKYWASSETAPFVMTFLMVGEDAFKKAWDFYARCFPGTHSEAEEGSYVGKGLSLMKEYSEKALNAVLGEDFKSSAEGVVDKSAPGGLAMSPPFWGGGEASTEGTLSLRVGHWLQVRDLVVDSMFIEPSPELVYVDSVRSRPMWVRVNITLSCSRRPSSSEVRNWYTGG